MAKKVFISVLGTGFYGKCQYNKGDDFTSSKTRFIQQATLEMLTRNKEWTASDAAYIFLTKDARKDNWKPEGNKRYNKYTKAEETYIGLKDALNSSHLPFPVTPIDIPMGCNEKEMWEIFERVYGCLGKGDELFFDLTHGFRYLPMLVLVLGNYAKFLKEVKVQSITYGNYETRENDTAPIIDLTPLSALQDWTSAASLFEKTGTVKAFTQSLSGIQLQQQTKAQRRFADNVTKLQKRLNDFDGQIMTCRGYELMDGSVTAQTKQLIDEITEKDSDIPHPLLEIIKSVAENIQEFGTSRYGNLTAAINWCVRYRLVQQGYTLCQESIITSLCDKFANLNSYEGKDGYKKCRDYWTALLGIADIVADDESMWTARLAENRTLTHALLKLEWVRELRRSFNQLRNNRNQLNHAGFIGKVSSDNILRNFTKCMEENIGIFEKELESPILEFPSGKIFLNLSNHPSAQWTAEQLEAAREYGEVEDMPFPDVAPEAGSEEIRKIAGDIVSEVMEKARHFETTVHVMGEMSLTFQVVGLLKARGVRCVCSTSRRTVTDEGDGRKTVEFHFNRFRDYE